MSLAKNLTSVPLDSHGSASAVLARLLARLFLVELDAPSLEALRQPEVLHMLDKLEPGCADYLAAKAWKAGDLDLAAADFCELFLLPGGVSAQASRWLGEDPMESARLIDLRVGQIAAGLDLSFTRQEPIPPDDHLGVLLTLIATVLDDRADAVAAALGRELLSPWVPTFGQELLNRTKNPMYRAAARLLVRWCKDLEGLGAEDLHSLPVHA